MKDHTVVAARGTQLITRFIFAGALALICVPALSLPICGPGQDWVDTCDPGTGGQDTFDSVFNFSFEWLWSDIGPLITNSIYDLALVGPTTVNRDDPLSHPGLLNTEIITAQGDQLHPTLGPLTLRIGTGNGVSTATIGEVNQTTPLIADSFFDVFFELDSALGTPIFNIDPLQVTADLTCLPPGAINPNTGQTCASGRGYDANLAIPVYLYANFGTGSSQQVALVVASSVTGAPPHHDVAEPASFVLLGLGLLGLTVSRRRNL